MLGVQRWVCHAVHILSAFWQDCGSVSHTFTVGSAALSAGAATVMTVSAADLTYGAAVSAALFTTGAT